ncbi:hypothetical protein LSH36_406g02059 [Paralvinella palmiformis]|uniref:Uncharacterized protein n=1 Tax=Paralvinella palmiformis TaxID=53620 RepID=A0AAD9JCS2_9ANNE|nr:hypothetical protein LSH36_406g02059 [Paralvinella palmiformis]
MKIPRNNISEDSAHLDRDGYDQSNGSTNGSANDSHDESGGRTMQVHEEAVFGAIDRFCDASEQTYEQFLASFTYFRPAIWLSYPPSGCRIPNLAVISPIWLSYPPSSSHIPRLALISPGGGLALIRIMFLKITSGCMPHPNRLCFSLFISAAEKGSDEQHLHNQLALDTEPIHFGAGQQHASQRSRSDPEASVVNASYASSCEQCTSGNRDNKVDDEDHLEEEVDNFVDDEGVLSDSEDGPIIDDYQPYVASFASAHIEGDHGTTSKLKGYESTGVTSGDGQEDETSDQVSLVPFQNLLSDTRHSSTDSPKDVKFDSTGQPVDGVDQRVSEVSQVENDEISCGAKQEPPYPGEVIEGGAAVSRRSIEEVTNIRRMQYSAKMADTNNPVIVDEPNWEEDGNSNRDEVEPFSLDADFDYDNVILTPKYTKSELDELSKIGDG